MTDSVRLQRKQEATAAYVSAYGDKPGHDGDGACFNQC